MSFPCPNWAIVRTHFWHSDKMTHISFGTQVLYGADCRGQPVDVWAAGVLLYVLLTGGAGPPDCPLPRQRLILCWPQQGVRQPAVVHLKGHRYRLGSGLAAWRRYTAQIVPMEAVRSVSDAGGRR